MKKTMYISLAMLIVVATVMFALSASQQKQWTKSQSDDVNLTINSPVEEVHQRYKEYKWDYIYNMPGSEITKETWNALGVDFTEDLFDFDQAGYKACEMMDKALPELNIQNRVFYGRLRSVPAFRPKVMVYSFVDYEQVDEKSFLYRSCEIEIHTGKCVQAIAGNKELWALQQYQPYIEYPKLTEQQIYDIVDYSVDICSKFGYSDFTTYAIRENPGNIPAQYWVYIYTSKDELMRVSLAHTDEKIYFREFSNETMMGYNLETNESPEQIPAEILIKHCDEKAENQSETEKPFAEISTIKTKNGHIALHICSMEHSDCADLAEKLGINPCTEGKTQHCPFGNIEIEPVTEKILQSTITCTHNAVGKTDNVYLIITYDKQTCTGCAYNTNANYKEELAVICG